MNVRKIISAAVSAAMLSCVFTGCSDSSDSGQTASETEGTAMQTEETVTGTEPVKEMPLASVDTSYKAITVDGDTVNMDEGTVYRGLGVVTGNNSSRLLMDYKTQNPDAYREIMELLFKPDYGAGLTHVKIEFGTDVNSSSGTEPSIMRSADEEADVTRGAGFMFAADALSINPDITVDLLRWGEPKWVTDAFDESQEAGFEARYKWYKAAIDGAYDTYGMKFTHISADANEADVIDTDWIIYFAGRLKNETDERYDYGAIKIVASDELGSWKIADEMTNNEALRDAVDILGEHYNTWASDNAKRLNKDYGKEIWYTEGVSSANIARLAVTSNGSGINGTNGALDVCNRIINGYYNGRMTMYEYQPAVAAYYSGAKFFPKSLINAQNPWSGYYEADCGIWTSAHFTHFIGNGWRYIDSACYGDGKENHSISDTTNNYMTVTDTETGDYSIIICNDSEKQRNYTFTLENMKLADAPITIWETRGPDEGQAYDENYFKNIGTYQPVETDGKYAYSIEVKPYSIVTVTTLDKSADTSVYKCSYEDIPLDINYSDDFEYSDDFLSARGNAPLYTTDYGGAFEVAEIDGGKVLMQMINADNKPTDWRFRGTPDPITSLGDDRWSNYSAEIDFKFDGDKSDNYVSFGVRYLTAELDPRSAENGYSLKIYPGGYYELKKNADTVLNGNIDGFDPSVWHTIKLTAAGKHISAELDCAEIAAFDDESGYAHSGRVSIGSGLYNNVFDNLKIAPAEGYKPIVTRVDDHDASIVYSGGWDRTVPDEYIHFNRTRSKADITEESPEEKTMEFSFEGGHFALIGKTPECGFDVYIDGELFESAKTEGVNARQCFYSADVPDGEHTVRIAVTSGRFAVDVIEY
ncbi:MAG: glycosyl hydrolase family 59 [Oscillospiraceae bacterium]|nr:glycosyl hydrolase family 59 [Oscillospiraceae bacterium]